MANMQGGTAYAYAGQESSPERVFWIEFRRGLIQMVRAIDKFQGIEPSQSRARSLLHDDAESEFKTR